MSLAKHFFQQSRYLGKFEDAKANIAKKVEEFEDAVNMCLRREVRDIHDSVEWLKKPLIATFFLLAGSPRTFQVSSAIVTVGHLSPNPTLIPSLLPLQHC